MEDFRPASEYSEENWNIEDELLLNAPQWALHFSYNPVQDIGTFETWLDPLYDKIKWTPYERRNYER